MLKIFDGNTPTNVQRVRERLEFVQMISGLSDQFARPFGGIRKINPGQLLEPWLHFDALRNHLLLTCFDLLGQPNDYQDFQSWLADKSKFEERSKIINTIEPCEDQVEMTRKIHRSYLDRYGTKSSFFKFINCILSEDARNQLFHSVSVTKIDKKNGVRIGTSDDPDKKCRVLYDIRNAYTHGGVSVGSFLVMPGASEWDTSDGTPKKGWVISFFYERGNDVIEQVGMRDWPDALLKAIKSVVVT